MRGVTIAWHLSRRQQVSELSARAWSASLGIRGFASGDEKVRVNPGPPAPDPRVQPDLARSNLSATPVAAAMLSR